MAGRIPDETKNRLKEAGLWQEFLDRRVALKAQGVKPTEATNRALVDVSIGAPIPPSLAKDPNPGGVAAEQTLATQAVRAPSRDEGRLEVAPAALAGKMATEPEIIQWVARNIDHPEPDPEDCPDPFAWTLLRQCRENAGLQFFIEKLWSKLIPSRSQLDTRGGGEFDGKLTLALIDRVEEIRDEAMGGK